MPENLKQNCQLLILPARIILECIILEFLVSFDNQKIPHICKNIHMYSVYSKLVTLRVSDSHTSRFPLL